MSKTDSPGLPVSPRGKPYVCATAQTSAIIAHCKLIQMRERKKMRVVDGVDIVRYKTAKKTTSNRDGEMSPIFQIKQRYSKQLYGILRN